MGVQAFKFLNAIHPYAIIKLERISLALLFWEHKGPYHNTNQAKPSGFVATCERFHQEMRRLNKKGPTS